jgi:DNA-binding LacI/PurR family transcriptional regulator
VLHARGLEVPRDLSVIGRYSTDFARTFSLPYSAIESAPDRLGRMAVRQLVRRIESPTAKQEPHIVRFITPELVDRGSIGHPPDPNAGQP